MLGVALGAFGAHGLRGRIPAERLEVYQTGALAERLGSTWPRVTALFALGIAIFGGSLYLLAITGQRWLGAITPLGGVCFLAGWGLLALQAWKQGRA